MDIWAIFECNNLSHVTLGPVLPVPLEGHTESTVPLGHGQAILGGLSIYLSQKKIYVINCQRRDCFVSTLTQELSVQRSYSVVIPLPDNLAGCVTGGKEIITSQSKLLQESDFFDLQTVCIQLLSVMAFVTMKLTIFIVLLMVEIVVDHVSIETTVQIVSALLEKMMHRLKIILLLLMAIVMMKSTMKIAIMTVETAVEHA